MNSERLVLKLRQAVSHQLNSRTETEVGGQHHLVGS